MFTLAVYCINVHIRALDSRERECLPTKLLSYCQQIACGMSFLVERGCVVSRLATRYVLLSEKDVCKVDV